MSSESKRLTIRLGSLAIPLTSAAAAAGVSEGEYARRALEEKLGVEHDRLPAGNPEIKKLAAKRWAKSE